MGDITANISQHELDCKCGDPSCRVTIDYREPVIQLVQATGDYWLHRLNGKKLKIIINSAARCFVYNRSPKIGSNDGSRHPRCQAIDFKIFIDDVQVSPNLIYSHLDSEYPHSLGLGLYKTFTHVDTRPWKARWSNS